MHLSPPPRFLSVSSPLVSSVRKKPPWGAEPGIEFTRACLTASWCTNIWATSHPIWATLTLCGCSVKPLFFAEFHWVHSVPNLEMDYSETHGFPRKKHSFLRGITKSVPSLSKEFFRNRIWWQPYNQAAFLPIFQASYLHFVCLFPASEFRCFHSK